MRRRVALAACLSLAPALAGAQVGHLPEKSPFRDLERRQELTIYGGRYTAELDPARVAPEGGPMAGVQYALHLGGPGFLVANSVFVLSERRVINPNALNAQRFLERRTVPLVLSDVGFAISLTGYKAWHGLVPSLGGGVGVGGAFDRPDTGSYKVGYPFLITFRPSLRIAPRGRWQARIDGTNYFYRIRYPDSYFTKTTTDPTVLDPTAGRNVWTRNVGLTGGIVYTFGR